MERRRQAEAEATSVLHGALVLLNRGGVCKEPLTPTMFCRPNPKGLQAVLHLLHYRIRGAARTKKELQHIYPVLEPVQAREFKAAMQEWIKELGAAGQVAPDTVKYFVTAYQGSNSLRTVLMLLDLSTLALARELGEGPHATLPSVELMQPDPTARGRGPRRGAQQAATAARRVGQARLDEVVAAMQQLKQLQAQAVGQLAAGQAGSGSVAVSLASRAPSLFSGSQAALKRCDLVHELLACGPPLSANPEAVGPDSWADLVSAGRGAASAAAAAATAAQSAMASPAAAAAARRLSNPAQEASKFAAEGLAADADVIAVHNVLVQRCAAASAALQAAAAAAGDAGGAVSSSELQAALAESAVYREALVASIRNELAAARVRAELQQQQQAAVDNASASAGTTTGNGRPSLLQLLAPSTPLHNPVTEGTHAAQEAAAAASAGPAATTVAVVAAGWVAPEADKVQELRRSMWQRAHAGANSSDQSAAAGLPTTPAAALAGPSASGAEAAAAPLLQSPAAAPAAARAAAVQSASACGQASSSRATRYGSEAAQHVDSPNLSVIISPLVGGWPLLSEESLEEPEAAFGSPHHLPQRVWDRSELGDSSQLDWRQCGQGGRHDEEQGEQRHVALGSGLRMGSPCPAESCASASVVGDNHAGGSFPSTTSGGSRAPAAGGAGAGGRALPMAVSPMLSAAASCLLPRPQQHLAEQPRQQHASRPLSTPSRGLGGRAPGDAAAPLAHINSLSPAASTPARLRRLDSSSSPEAEAGSPLAVAAAWRHHAAAAPAGASLPGLSAGNAGKQAASVSLTLTPPRPLDVSPLLQRQQSLLPRPSGGIPAAWHAGDGGDCGSDCTPVSKPQRRSSSNWAEPGAGPALSPVLQPMQQQQQRRQGGSSPGSPLLASCFKTKPAGLGHSPFASQGTAAAAAGQVSGSHDLQQQEQPGRWSLAAVRSMSSAPQHGLLASPHGTSGRRRSAGIITTSSPLATARSYVSPAAQHRAHCLVGAGSNSGGSESSDAQSLVAADDLLRPMPLDTPTSHALAYSAADTPTRGQWQQQHGDEGQGSQRRSIFTPPRQLLGTPGGPSCHVAAPAPAASKAGAGSAAATAGGAAAVAHMAAPANSRISDAAIDALRARMAMLSTSGGRR